MKLKVFRLIFFLFGLLLMMIPTFAADILYRLTHDDQYALILGTVKQVGVDKFRLVVASSISGHRLPKEIQVISRNKLELKLTAGDYLLASIDRKAGNYLVKWGLFRVSSIKPASLEILAENYAPGDRAALEYYIHNGGRENNFFFIERSAFVKHTDGTLTQIYPRPKSGKARGSHQRVLICTDRDDYSLALSSTVGIGLYPVYLNQNGQAVRCHWRTDYGQFLFWEAPSYKVKSLGQDTIDQNGIKIYWSPPLNNDQKIIVRKNRAQVILTVEEINTGKILGQGMLWIGYENGIARVEL